MQNIVIRDCASARFCGSEDHWVSSPQRALRFGTFADAADYVQQHHIQGNRVLAYATLDRPPKGSPRRIGARAG